MPEYVTRQTYWCMTCADDQIMDREKMVDHLRRVHNIEPVKSKPEIHMVIALDFSGGYSNTWELTLEGVVFRKNVTRERIRTRKQKV